MTYAFFVLIPVLLYLLAWSLAVTRLAWRAWRATGQFGWHCTGAVAASLGLAGALGWAAWRLLQLTSALA